MVILKNSNNEYLAQTLYPAEEDPKTQEVHWFTTEKMQILLKPQSQDSQNSASS